MRTHVRSLALIAIITLSIGGCAGNVSQMASPSTTTATVTATPSTPSTATSTATASPSTAPPSWLPGTVPSAAQLAAVLVTKTDNPGTWRLNVPDLPDPDAVSGVVTDKLRATMPTVGFCARASKASVAAAKALRWQAFRELDKVVDDPIDTTETVRSGRMIFFQEFLLGASASQVTATFTALRQGSRACLGPFPASGEGPGRTDEIALPTVGDDRYGELSVFAEARGDLQWRVYNALVRDGTVLMIVHVGEIVGGPGVTAQVTTADVGTFVRTAVAKLP